MYVLNKSSILFLGLLFAISVIDEGVKLRLISSESIKLIEFKLIKFNHNTSTKNGDKFIIVAN